MKRHHFIGIDVHCQFCEIAVVDAVGKVVCRDRCATTISTLLAVLEKVPRPRSLVAVRTVREDIGVLASRRGLGSKSRRTRPEYGRTTGGPAPIIANASLMAGSRRGRDTGGRFTLSCRSWRAV